MTHQLGNESNNRITVTKDSLHENPYSIEGLYQPSKQTLKLNPVFKPGPESVALTSSIVLVIEPYEHSHHSRLLILE